MSPMKVIRRSFSSCLELTRMWRSTERASLEKKPSMRLSHDPCVGVNVKVKRPMGCAASQLVVSRETWAEWDLKPMLEHAAIVSEMMRACGHTRSDLAVQLRA